MIKKLPWAEILVTVLALAAGIAVYVYAHRDEGRLKESKLRGTAVVEALHEYRAEHGAYPDSLARLVPEYVAAIEPPTWGLRRWTYRTWAPVGDARDTAVAPGRMLFQLSVAAGDSGYPVLYYDVVAERWVLNN